MSCEECIFKGMSPREAITTNHHHRVCGHHANPYKLTLVERSGGGGGGFVYKNELTSEHGKKVIKALAALGKNDPKAFYAKDAGFYGEKIVKLYCKMMDDKDADKEKVQMLGDAMNDWLEVNEEKVNKIWEAYIEECESESEGGASATPASGSQRLCVSSEHLEILTLPVLRDHCESLDEPKSGNKDVLISRLVTARIAYDMLLMDDLKDILHDMNLPVSGNKSELIARIIGRSSSAARGPSVGGSGAASAAAGGGGSGGVAEARTTPITPFVGGTMTKATFRSRMERAGRPLKPGQDVCHIIAEANGGANHSDNFFIAGEAFNRSTGNRHDQLIAYIAGREAADRAVAISRAMNGYSGPNAKTLYRQGEEVFRAVRAENRGRNE